jgi:uncharacterized protein
VPVVDAHVHLFPDKLFDAIWNWFDQNAWPIVERSYSDQILTTLEDNQVDYAVGLCYAHRPGLAESLNGYMADLAGRHPKLIALGTIFPGEPEQEVILEQAFETHQLRGIKLHCHVQRVAPDADEMAEVCEAVCKHNGVMIIHAGRAPVLPYMQADILKICSVDKTARMLKRFPDMKTIVPHLGMDEYQEYRDLLKDYDNLYLDTTMAIGGYFGGEPPIEKLEDISDRVLFGTDFPNLPYPYDRELLALRSSGLSPEALDRILASNAKKLFGLD